MPSSYPLLKITFVLTFLLFLGVLTKFVLLQQTPLPIEQANQKTDLAQTQIKPGLNVDNLPLVKIDYGKYRPSETVQGGGDNDHTDPSISIAQRRQACLSRGAYLGPESTDVNCSDYCGLPAEDVQYIFLTANDVKSGSVVIGRQPMKPGSYCMPTLMATCNRNTSLVVYSINGWLCLPRTDAFAGSGGNRIVVCDGKLRDNALRVVYEEFIPPTLVLNNVYTDKLSDGTYRFECLHNHMDVIGNKYLTSRLNRLHLLRNWCVENIPFAADVNVDLINGICECVKFEKDKDGRCTACNIHFDNTSKQIAFNSKPCYSFTDTIAQFEDYLATLRKQLDLPLNSHEALKERTLLPCGFNDQGTSSEKTLPRCQNYYIALYNPPLPSHNTLNFIDQYSTD